MVHTDENLSASEDTEDLQLPSGKLGSITRKQNEITKYIDSGQVDISFLQTLQESHESKIKAFEKACNAELNKKLSEEDTCMLKKYIKKQEKKYLFFKNKLEKWLLEEKYASEEDEESEAESEDSKGSKATKCSASSKKSETNELLAALLKTQASLELPNIEPKIFSGEDVVEYNTFKLSFQRLIEEKCLSNEDRYYYLLRYTSGEAHRLVSSCQHPDAKKAYESAKTLLDSQYGNEHIIAQQYLEELARWPSIKSEDSVELNKFAMFLTTCLNMMTRMSALNQLNSWRDIMEVVMKLPYDLRRSFRSLASKKIEENKVVDFKLLVDYVNRQAKERNLPVIGQISDKSLKNDKSSKNVNKSKAKTFYVSSDTTETLPCANCKKTNHVLNDCIFFLKKSLNEREEFVKNKRLCFACLQGGHRSKDCKDRLKCRICEKQHPTSLHRKDRPAKEERKPPRDEEDRTSEVNMVTRSSIKIACPAVPVVVTNKITGKKEKTYAALDNFSTSSYMDGQLMKKLGLSGRKTDLQIKTIEGRDCKINATIANNIEISSLEGDYVTTIPKVFAKENWPFSHKDSPSEKDVTNIQFQRDIPFQFINEKIGILVGMDMPEILEPLETVKSNRKGPYASRHHFGWALNGPIKGSSKLHCFRTTVIPTTDEDLNEKFNKVFAYDFETPGKLDDYSIENKAWLEDVSDSTEICDGQFQIKVPINEKLPDLSNNYYQVKARFDNLTKKLNSDESLREEYCEFMQLMMENEFMEEVPKCDDVADGKYWYLAHHPVHHKQKQKIRIVFDCSLKYKGLSINDVLKKGPDLTNTLVGVLLRFRTENIAVIADISKMFYRVQLPVEQRDMFRFLWYPNNDLTMEPTTYRMKVHIFGATSSPAIANFALRKCAEQQQLTEVRDVINKSFYVDDMMSSFANNDEAITTVKKVSDVLDTCGFDLTSFASNSKEVLNTLPKEKLSKSLENIEINRQELPEERTLGIKWLTNTDEFGYSIKLSEDVASTKRIILSTIHALFDPLFLASPAIVPAKRLFQACCQEKLGWDDPLPKEIEEKWLNWKKQVIHLNDFKIQRCYKLTDKQIVDSQLHIFCDGSLTAYGAVAYIRQIDSDGDIFVSIVMSKSRLTPLNRSSLKTTPRIELNAAKIGACLYQQISQELNGINFDGGVYFWSDSAAVLAYISSDKGRFHAFVSNRVAFIRSITDVNQWKKVPGKLNPADLVSRGIANVKEFINNKMWTEGPPFLRQDTTNWPQETMEISVPIDDPEIKHKAATYLTQENETEKTPTQKLLESTSDLGKLTLRIAAFLRLKKILMKKEFDTGNITAQEITASELELWKQAQMAHLSDMIDVVRQNKSVPKSNNLHKMNVFIDKDNLLRIGGRLKNSSLSYDSKHPILLHANSIERTHKNLGHLGREAVSTYLKRSYHIIGGNKSIRRILKKCIICKKVQGKPCTQMMHDLPADRVDFDSRPFTHVGTDLFGPFYVSKGRGDRKEKRWGVIFTCLSSRAAHLEIVTGLDTDSYINALRRFTCRRGTPKLIRSDNGTNLTSADKELKAALREIDTTNIENICSQKKIDWKFQPPQASHHGGAFEREIRTVRKILNSLLCEFSNKIKITDDLLSTLFCEVENILNCRPLTIVTTDADDQVPLTANDILRLDSGDTFPLGTYEQSDSYMKRRWRQAQYLADIFWTRFKREYLPSLQLRTKWHNRKPSLQADDIVLVIDKLIPRNEWSVGKVVKAKTSDDGCVRSCEVALLKNKYVKNSHDKIIINRPISKLVLLWSPSDN